MDDVPSKRRPLLIAVGLELQLQGELQFAGSIVRIDGVARLTEG